MFSSYPGILSQQQTGEGGEEDSTLLYLPLDSDFSNSGGGNYTINKEGSAVIDTGFSFLGGGSLRCNNNYAKLSAPEVLPQLGGSDFRISLSVYFNSLRSDNRAYVNSIFSNDVNSTDRGIFIVRPNGNSAGNFLFRVRTTELGFFSCGTTFSTVTGQWYEVVCERIAGFMRLIIDGDLKSQVSIPSEAVVDSLIEDYYIGIAYDLQSARALDGWVDEFRLDLL